MRLGDPRDLPYFRDRTLQACRRPYAGGSKVLSGCVCADATLTADKIDAVFRKWLLRVPHPFAAAYRKAGYRDHLSILQSSSP